MWYRVAAWFRSLIQSFYFAFEGWAYVLRSQRNAWIHGSISLFVVGLAFWLRLPVRDWALLVLTISVVWAAEFANTAVEALVDLVAPNQHPLAKVAKDVAAAAVLVAAMGSVVVGLLLLGPPLWDRLF